MPSKKIPLRKSKMAEDYAKKVRMEPPKATRQESPLVAGGKITARQHNMDKKPTLKRSPAEEVERTSARCKPVEERWSL